MWSKFEKMTKNNFKLFPKKSSELARSSELAPSELAKHPCNVIFFQNTTQVFQFIFELRRDAVELTREGKIVANRYFQTSWYKTIPKTMLVFKAPESTSM